MKLSHKITLCVLYQLSLWSNLTAQIDLNDPKVKEAARRMGVSKNQIKLLEPMIDESVDSKNIIDNSEFNESFEGVSQSSDNSQNLKDIEEAYELDKSNNDISGTSDNKSNDAENNINDLNTTEINDANSNGVPSKYFGYNIFNGNPELFQKSIDISTDENYIIGPGDEIIIMLWGDTEINRSYKVSKDGYLFIQNVGQVFVNGLNLEKIEKKLFKLLKKVYSSLGPSNGNATTFFDVSLGSQVLRPIRIFIVGEIEQPGAYDVKPTTSLFNSLFYCNGPSVQGSLRKIKLIRNNEDLAEIDYYDYLLTGKQINDERLKRDDVIFIPNRGKTVQLVGEIRRPSIYEAKNKEDLLDLIKIAGGLKNSTFMKRAQIKRILPSELRHESGMDRTLIDVDLRDVVSGAKRINLYDGDIISFFSITNDIGNMVTINGAVKRPGSYDMGTGLRIKDIISKANGLFGDTYMERVDIIRSNRDYSETQIVIDLGKALDGDPEHNIKLESGDIITSYRTSEFQSRGKVSIEGYVLNPGELELKDSLTISDLVFHGGGFNDEKRLLQIHLARADLIRIIDDENKKIIPFRLDSVLNGGGVANMQLNDGDVIKVYSKFEISGLSPGIVKINGKIKRPGIYPLYENMRIRDLLFLGMGFDDSNYKKEIFLKRADLYRKYKNNRHSITRFDLLSVLDSTDEENNFRLFDEDEIVIYESKSFMINDSVQIYGTPLPGRYLFKQGMTLGDLILESGGVDPNIGFYRAEVSRKYSKEESSNFSMITTFDFENKSEIELEYSNDLDFGLFPNDNVFIRPKPILQNEKLVNINGYVKFPGQYALSGPLDQVTDLINRAGGLTDEAYPLASLLIRSGDTIKVSFEKILKNPRSKLNFTLLEGDEIIIKSRPNLVRIVGSVNSSGVYQFIPNYRINDYIKVAGGFSPDASRASSYVKYPNGISRPLSYLGFPPKVMDGSIIFIGTKEEVEPFSFTEYATNIANIWADLSQAYLMLMLIANQNQ